MNAPLPRFMVCHILEPLPEIHRFTAWPLHLTVVGWFAAPEEALTGILVAIQETAMQMGSFEVRVGDNAWYGPVRDVPVREVVDDSGKLMKLHRRLIAEIQGCGGAFVNLEYSLDHYAPHVSQKADRSGLTEGSVIRCSSLTVIEKTPRTTDPNEVLTTAAL